MQEWPLEGPSGYDKETVYRYCVDIQDPHVAAWQKTRLSMKGVPTHKKLEILWDWYNLHRGSDKEESTRVQVFNYLGALRRGGQLSLDNKVRKFI